MAGLPISVAILPGSIVYRGNNHLLICNNTRLGLVVEPAQALAEAEHTLAGVAAERKRVEGKQPPVAARLEWLYQLREEHRKSKGRSQSNLPPNDLHSNDLHSHDPHAPDQRKPG